MTDNKGNKKSVSLIEIESDRIDLTKSIYEIVVQFLRACSNIDFSVTNNIR